MPVKKKILRIALLFLYRIQNETWYRAHCTRWRLIFLEVVFSNGV